MESCSIGQHVGKPEDCHETTYIKKTGLYRVFELPEDSCELLLRRADFAEPDCNTTVCFHHEKFYVDKYAHLQRSCCDPFALHQGTLRRKSLHHIDLQTANIISSETGTKVHPGQKLCPQCAANMGSAGSAVVSSEEEPEPGPSGLALEASMPRDVDVS